MTRNMIWPKEKQPEELTEQNAYGEKKLWRQKQTTIILGIDPEVS